MPGEFLTRPALVRLSNNPRRPWMLTEPLIYRTGDGETITVPSGYPTDFASVPWIMRRIFPQDGPWTYPAILHDYLCDIQPVWRDSSGAADIMAEGMVVEGCKRWQIFSMVQAVRLFGPKW